jgi:ribonuclease HI
LIEYLNEETDSSPTLAETITKLLKLEKVVIFTDGSTNANSGVGGYGIILKYKERVKELSGGFRKTTNNRMEIVACIEGLRALKQKSEVVIFSDSQYVVNSISKGWARKWQAQGWMRNDKERAENSDLWAQLLDLCNQHNVEFQWVKGHNGTKENERCDQLAMEATQKKNLPADVGFENGKPENPAPLFSAIES